VLHPPRPANRSIAVVIVLIPALYCRLRFHGVGDMVQEMPIEFLDSTNLELYDSISISVIETGQEILLWERDSLPKPLGNVVQDEDRLQFQANTAISNEQIALISAKLRERIRSRGFHHSITDQLNR
jgi:hypothetical protein